MTLNIMTPSIMKIINMTKLSIMRFIIITHSIMPINKMTFSIIIRSIMTFSIISSNTMTHCSQH